MQHALLTDAYVLTDAPGLPPKPPAPKGRAVFWIYVLGEPGAVYKGHFLKFGEQEIDEHVHRFGVMAARGYTPPLAVEHPGEIHPTDDKGQAIPSTLAQLAEIPDGLRKGDVLKVAKHKVDGKWALIAAISPAMPAQQAIQAVELGQIKYFSPGLGPVETDRGDVLAMVLKELSLVAAPHQKTAPTHVLGAEQRSTMAEEKEAPPSAQMEDGESKEPTVAELAARLGELEKGMATMMQFMEHYKAMEDEKEDEPAAAQMSEQARTRIAALESQVLAMGKRTFDAEFPTGGTVALGEDAQKALYRLSLVDADAVNALLGAAVMGEQRGEDLPAIGGGHVPKEEPTNLWAACMTEAKGDASKAREIYMVRRRQELENV